MTPASCSTGDPTPSTSVSRKEAILALSFKVTEWARKEDSHFIGIPKLSKSLSKWVSVEGRHQGSVVQSIVSLTSSLRGQLVMCFRTL